MERAVDSTFWPTSVRQPHEPQAKQTDYSTTTCCRLLTSSSGASATGTNREGMDEHGYGMVWEDLDLKHLIQISLHLVLCLSEQSKINVSAKMSENCLRINSHTKKKEKKKPQNFIHFFLSWRFQEKKLLQRHFIHFNFYLGDRGAARNKTKQKAKEKKKERRKKRGKNVFSNKT